jgi:hypothetical protein
VPHLAIHLGNASVEFVLLDRHREVTVSQPTTAQAPEAGGAATDVDVRLGTVRDAAQGRGTNRSGTGFVRDGEPA